jgi:hypothetical protein
MLQDCKLYFHQHIDLCPLSRFKNFRFNLALLRDILYGCETWSLTLSEEHILRASENRVMRRIFGPKRDEVTGMVEVAQ